MLLQLHILLPEIEDAPFDDVFDLVYEGGFFVPDDGKVTDERFFSTPRGVVTEFQTCLFEERQDNLEGVEQIYQELVEMFPNSTVFKYRVEETIGEYRSVADPDERIILYVGNTELEEPRIRWRQELEPFEISPRVANNRVFHATSGSVFALDGTSGELLWEHAFDQVISRPEARDDFVVAAGAFCIRGLDASTGEQIWHVDFDQTEIEMIESRAEVGPEYVYLGTRAGEVLKISKA